MPVCTVCSGVDFICESGYFYCAECQTQSQDVREELLDNDHDDDEEELEIDGGGRRSVGIKRKASAKSSSFNDHSFAEASITSWEGFNMILAGLTNELINLGVNPFLKTTILKLWSTYLRTMEVAFFSTTEAALPKLGPNFQANDAALIYGYTIDKKNKSIKKEERDGEDSLLDDPNEPTDTFLTRQKNLKQKRTAFRKNYERVMQEMSLASQTLTDCTLEMLAVSSIADDADKPPELQFNSLGEQYRGRSLHSHPGLLMRNKLICLLYLGLASKDEELKLSDLLRSIAEKHLSYTHLQKFFTSEKQMQGCNSLLFIKHQPCPRYQGILSSSGRLAAYIGLKGFKPPPMKELIQHYIKELNLPGQVCLLAQRLLALLPKPRVFIPTLNKNFPNWEGRAMAHIIIALKLLFGLDDSTEHRNSRIARRINEVFASQNETLRLFVWDDWEQFCNLRRTALLLFHEPSFMKSKWPTSMIQNIDPILGAWKDVVHSERTVTKRYAILNDIYKNLLSRLRSNNHLSENCVDKLSFPFTTSPLTTYIQTITKAFQEGRVKASSDEWSQVLAGLNLEMLNQQFFNASVDYLTHPNEYIIWSQQHGLRIGLHSGSAAPAIWAQKQGNLEQPPERSNYRVKVYLNEIDQLPTVTLPLPSISSTNFQTRNYTLCKPLIFPAVNNTGENIPLPHIKEMQVDGKGAKVPRKRGRPPKLTTPKSRGRPKTVKKCLDSLPKEDKTNMLHIPHSEYWMWHIPGSPGYVEFPAEGYRLPASFMFLLEECASLLEMEPYTLYEEVMIVETLHKDLSRFLDPSTDHTMYVEGDLFTQGIKDLW